MTSAEWDMTVPADDAELAAEFRRRDMRPGNRLHVVVRAAPAPSAEELPAYFGSFDGPADFAERSEIAPERHRRDTSPGSIALHI